MTNKCPIAVVGVSALFPGSSDLTGFWRDILAGTDQVREIPESYWLIDDYYNSDQKAEDKTYGRRGAFVDAVDFDCIEHGILPSQVQDVDTVQLMALIVAQSVLRDAAKGDFAYVDRERMSVILGVAGGTEQLVQMGARLQRPVWLKSLREAGIAEDKAQDICQRIADHYVPWSEASFPGLLGNVVAGRIANRFDLGGTNCVVDAACASSLSALSMAIGELYLGNSDCVIAGGADALNDILMYMCFSKTPALSLTGDCRPFSDNADGTILGEGVGMVALRRLADAERDGDTIYAVIKGIGSSSDGAGTAVYAPVSEGQALAINRAYQNAAFEPHSIGLIEAHGTGTKAGDKAEFSGLKLAFGMGDKALENKQWCALGSVKSQIGHTKGAAGAASLIKTVLALHHKVLPPTIKVDRPNPAFDIDNSPFYLNTQTRPWISPSDQPRRAGISSFGFGGSNFHVAVEEYTKPQKNPRRIMNSNCHLFLFGADKPDALLSTVNHALSDCPNDSEAFEYLARQSQQTFSFEAPCRLAVVAENLPALKDKLKQLQGIVGGQPDRSHNSPAGWFYGRGEHQGKIACLFPGQGSQYLDMGAALAMTFAPAQSAWDAAETLFLQESLAQVVFPKPVFSPEDRQQQQAKLNQTQWAQPAIGVASSATWQLLQSLGLHADGFAGHSYGEITALHAAQCFDHATLVNTAKTRGQLMADAAVHTKGYMTAVHASRDEVEPLLTGIDGILTLANLNSPRQVVVSGEELAISAFETSCHTAGLRYTRLPVATAFHSPIVSDAVTPFREYLQSVTFAPAKLPVYANKTAKPYPKTGKQGLDILAEQLASPVLFAEQISAMHQAGFRTFIEVGPGNVLTGLVNDCLHDQVHRAIATDQKGEKGLRAFWLALGQLSALGVPLDYAALWQDFREVTAPHERRQPKMSVPITGINYNRPYPPKEGASALPPANPNTPANVSPTPESAPVPPLSNDKRVDKVLTNFEAPSSPQHVSPPPVLETASGASSEWLAAFESIQRETNATHRQFLQLSEQALGQLGQLAGTAVPAIGQSDSVSSLPPYRQQAAQPMTAAAEPAVPTPAPVPEKTPADIPAAPAAPTTAAVDVAAIMLGVVAEKTGYPRDMLELSMSLEQDLGIDSIKRVEILSATLELVPKLPELNPSEMGALSTLQAVVDFIDEQLGDGGMPVQQTSPVSDAITKEIDVGLILMQIVAEKTGYPMEMLNPGMDLNNDLGIDSIKRVEILSAAKDGISDLPPLDNNAMANLSTLEEIASYIREQLASAAGPTAVSTAGQSPGTEPAQSPPAQPDVSAIMLNTVAEKTGYPLDMLDPGMDLEQDLGIDSIKRVEILSATTEQVANLPEFDAAEMASLKTLQQVIDFIESQLPQQSENSDLVRAVTTNPAVSVSAAESTSILRYRLQWHATALPGLTPSQLQQTLTIVPASSAFAAPLAKALQAGGMHAQVAEQPDEQSNAVISLHGLALFPSVEDALACNREVFALACQLTPQLESKAGVFIAVQKTGGRHDSQAPATDNHQAGIQSWSGGLSGLLKTAAQEWPQSLVRSIDVGLTEASERAVQQLAREIMSGGCQREVALAPDGQRFVPISVAAPTEAGELPLARNDVLVVTGGARGVTAASIIALCRQQALRVVLLGRTPLTDAVASDTATEAEIMQELLAAAQQRGEAPSPVALKQQVAGVMAQREVQHTLQAIAETGSQVNYIACDINNSSSLQQTLQQIRDDWGPIHGLVHGAGVLADKRLSAKTLAHFDLVFGTKVVGLRHFLQATQDDPLKVICLFSSVAARTGNIGQSDYAMANEVLNRVAGYLGRKAKTKVVAINWGPWDSGMVNEGLKQKFAAMGVTTIPLGTGADFFVNELSHPQQHTEVVIGGMPLHRPLANTQAPQQYRFSMSATVETLPHLDSHRVRGAVVLPMVQVVDWFKAAVNNVMPSQQRLQIDALSVLRGVVFDNQENSDTHFCLVLEETDIPGTFTMALLDSNDQKRYQATARYIDDTHPLHAEPRAAGSLSTSDIKPYEQLFHGPMYQSLAALSALDEGYASAELHGAQQLDWLQNGSSIDQAALDGALQLALLWGQHTLGKESLPLGVDRLVLCHDGPLMGPLRCVLTGRVKDSSTTQSDIWLFDADNTLVALVQGLRMFTVQDSLK